MLYATGTNRTSPLVSSYERSKDLTNPMNISTLSSIHPIDSESRQRRVKHSLFNLFSENSMAVKIFGHDDNKRKIFRSGTTNASNASSIHLTTDVEIDYRLARKALVRYVQMGTGGQL